MSESSLCIFQNKTKQKMNISTIIINSGRLHVYVKAESVVKLSQVNPTFVRIGDQGNLWRQGYLPLPANLTIENFQV